MTKNKKHLFLDFETFGQDVKDCAVIDISVMIVETDRMLSSNPYTLKSLADVKKFKISVKDQVDNYGYVVYKDSLDFWEKQSEEAKKHIRPLKSDMPLKEFTTEFIQYLIDYGKIDYWWSRANSYDPVIIWRIFNDVNKYHQFNEYLKFWKVRDIRTYIDAKLDFPPKNGFIPIQDEEFWNKVFVEHNSSWDVLADVLRMQAILRAENDMEQVKR